MKKHFLITLLLMAFVMAATAQNKKIAILETVDKKGDVPYGILLQLRSNLTYAISNTPGYEGYDRVDMAQIVGEHDFQRTGLVSEEQIRRLGVMTGCSSILVAEAAVYDKDNIIITAKILNVETASVERSVPPQISNINPEKMQKACTDLADKLLIKIPEAVEKSKPIIGKSLVHNGKDIYGNNSYSSMDGQKLTPTQYIEVLKSCPEAWYTYEKGMKHKRIGNILLISSGGCLLAATAVELIATGFEYANYFAIGASIAGTVGLTSIPFYISGQNKKNSAYKIYNQYCVKPTATLSFGPTANGIGVCLNF